MKAYNLYLLRSFPAFVITAVFISTFACSLTYGASLNINENFDSNAQMNMHSGLWDEITDPGGLLSLSEDVFFTAPSAIAVKVGNQHAAYFKKTVKPLIHDKLCVQFRIRLDKQLIAAPSFHILSVLDEKGEAFVRFRSIHVSGNNRAFQVKWRDEKGNWIIGKSSLSFTTVADVWDHWEVIISLKPSGNIKVRFNNNDKFSSITPADFGNVLAGGLAFGNMDNGSKSKGIYYLDDIFIGEKIHDRFNHGIISYTFDDGLKSQFVVARPILVNRGITASFFVITQKIDKKGFLSSGQIRKFIADGFEIGAHSVTHASLTTLSPAELDSEMVKSKNLLNSTFGINVRTFSYPLGEFNDEVVHRTLQHYDSGLTVNFRMNYFNRPSDVKGAGRINRIDVVYSSFTFNELKELIDQAEREGLWLIFTFHGLGSKKMTTRHFRQLLDYVKSKGIDVISIKTVKDLI